MRLLLINTCGGEGIVALAEDSAVLAVEVLPGRGTSEHLMPAIRRLLDGNGAAVRELAAIAVVVGPGSFTGVRVGLAAAKGLCEAGGVAMIAISRLALVAAQAAGNKGDVVALLDGGRGEYYCGVYRGGRCSSEELLRLEHVRKKMAGNIAVTCEARVAETLGPAIKLVHEPGAEEMLAAASARMHVRDWSDVATVDANYLRRTDAELLSGGEGMSAGLTIRKAVEADLPEILLLERETGTAPHWTHGEYQAMLRPAASDLLRRCLLVAADGRVVSGFAVGKVVEAEPEGDTRHEVEAEVESVVVRAAMRRQGLGSALLRSLIAWSREQGAEHLGLEARAASAGALRLYGGLGFVAIGRRPGYYHDPKEDAVVMRCELGLRAPGRVAAVAATGWLPVGREV